ncbi:ATP-binding protein [Micromonospora zamorensis]|uniref:magnesium chelatase subunit ChlI family protein n=1 Tax=Micromonospora zamorensis TaxID=709883 RepID=UPI0033C9BE80
MRVRLVFVAVAVSAIRITPWSSWSGCCWQAELRGVRIGQERECRADSHHLRHPASFLATYWRSLPPTSPPAKPSGDAHCECTALVRRRYLGRLSGPLLDRIDVQVRLMPVRAAELLAPEGDTEPSATVAARVATARQAAATRWAGLGRRVNAEVDGPHLRRPPWRLPARVTAELRGRLDSGSLSARGFDRVIRMAWTIADLDGRDRPDLDDVREAIQLRTGEAT